MRCVFKLICLLLVLSAARVWADDAPALDAAGAVAEALKNNPELRALEARIESARKGVGVAKAYSFNPEFNFEEGLDRHFGVSQTVEWPGKRTLRTALAGKDVAAAEVALDGFKVALAAEVRARLAELVAAQKIFDVRRAELQAAERFLDSARKRVEGGFAPRPERTQAEVEVVKARRELRAAENAVAVGRASVNVLLGREAQAPLHVAGELTAPPTDHTAARWMAAALERNTELRVLRVDLDKAGLSVRLARKEAAPDISVEPFYEYDPKNSGDNKVGVAVTVPLPVWRTNRPFVDAAQASAREIGAQYEKARRAVLGEVQKAHDTLRAARDQLAAFTPKLQAELETQLADTQEKYANGQVSFLVLLEIQRTYFEYLRDYYETLSNVRTAQSELEKITTTSLEELK